MIGVFAAAPGSMHGKAVGLDEIGSLRAGAGGVDRRMFNQPDLFLFTAGVNTGRNRLHAADGLAIIDQALAHPPVHRRVASLTVQPGHQRIARGCGTIGG